MKSEDTFRETPIPIGAKALDAFFDSVKRRTSDPVHLRLLTAAKKLNPADELENELEKMVQEILDED